MPKITRRLALASGITLLGLLISVGLIFMLFDVVQSLHGYLDTPADFLPGNETAALFSQAEFDEIQRFASWLPQVRELPNFPVPRTIAFVRLPDGKIGIAYFQRRSETRNPLESKNMRGWEERQIGAFSVRVSSEKLWDMLSSDRADRLSSMRDFRLLSRGKDTRPSWVLLKADLLPAPETAGDAFLAATLLSGMSRFSVFETGSGTILEFAGQTFPLPTADLPSATKDPPPLFSLSLSSAPDVWKALERGLKRTDFAILESKLLTLASSFFGDALSLQYDVFPLLSNAATMNIAKTASGGTIFLLKGNADRETLERTVDRMHESFHANLSTTRLVTRNLDKGRFIAQNIRVDTTVIREENRSEGPWTIHETEDTQNHRGLFTAISGTSFLLSSDRELLAKEIDNAASASSSSQGMAAARGILDLNALSQLFSGGEPVLLRPDSPVLPKSSAILGWTLKKNGEILSLSLDPL